MNDLRISLLFLACLSPLARPIAQAQIFQEREVLIPWSKAAPHGMDVLLVYAELPGKRPLAVLTHGTSANQQDRNSVSAWSLLQQATWFARRGWVALIVVRRGYGKSGGRPDYIYGGCPKTDYEEAGRASAEDLSAAIKYGCSLPQVDPTRIISAGVSTGGFATVALTANAPAGLLAAINFAGGWGRADHDVCNVGELVGAYRSFGKTSRIPMLWIYAENDRKFWPELAQKFNDAFRAGGGQNQFVQAPAIGEDGHFLFQRISAWSPIVGSFLKAQNLVWLPEPLPPPKSSEPAPPGLTETGAKAFGRYGTLGPHKAFAMSEHGFGMSVDQPTVQAAKKNATDRCRHSAPKGEKCKVVSIDGTPEESTND